MAVCNQLRPLPFKGLLLQSVCIGEDEKLMSGVCVCVSAACWSTACKNH